MDAKNKANFINAVAAGQYGTANESDSKSCVSGSIEIGAVAKEKEKPMPAFASVTENEKRHAVHGKYIEPESVFADGLPAWDIVPPQAMVRRH